MNCRIDAGKLGAKGNVGGELAVVAFEQRRFIWRYHRARYGRVGMLAANAQENKGQGHRLSDAANLIGLQWKLQRLDAEGWTGLAWFVCGANAKAQISHYSPLICKRYIISAPDKLMKNGRHANAGMGFNLETAVDRDRSRKTPRQCQGVAACGLLPTGERATGAIAHFADSLAGR